MELTSHPAALALPDAISLTVATQLWRQLDEADRRIATIRFELVYRVELQHGAEAAYEWLSHMVSIGTAKRYASIARSTAVARSVAIECEQWLGVSQWAALAPAAVDAQQRIAPMAAEHDMPAVMVQAAVDGTDERTAALCAALQRFQAAWAMLSQDEAWRVRALGVVRVFTCKYGD